MKAILNLCKLEGVLYSTPMAIIGKPAKLIQQQTSIPIRSVRDKDELLELISRYHGIKKMPTPLIIDDLSYLPTHTLPKLLKFIEESPLEIILLSTYDVLTPTILSRLKLVIKAPLNETRSNLLSPSQGRDRLNLSPDSHPLDKYRRWGQESPLIYLNEKTIPQRPNRQKIIQILE